MCSDKIATLSEAQERWRRHIRSRWPSILQQLRLKRDGLALCRGALYHGLMMGLSIALSDEYTSLSNREAGYGRSDIMMIPCPGRNHPGLVFELKRSPTVKQLPEKAAEALKQIEDKNYIAGFPPHITEVVGYGMAFCRKRCAIVQQVWKR